MRNPVAADITRASMIRNRVRALRRVLGKLRIRFLLLTNPFNVSYITSFGGADSWALIAPGKVYLLTDSRYTEQAGKECVNCEVVERSDALARCVADLIKPFRPVVVIGVEKTISIAEFEAIRKQTRTKLRPLPPIVEEIRCIKSTGEVAEIKKAIRIARRALTIALKAVRTGMVESELAGLIDLEMKKYGAVSSFPTCVAFGPNASRPHHQSGLRKLRSNDTILVDFGAKFNGYCCDVTRCFVVGKPSAFYRSVYEAVLKAQMAAIRLVKPGANMDAIGKAARTVISNRKLEPFKHGIGHGLGMEVHDCAFESRLKRGKPKKILRAGAVVTVEPGIYMPGKTGVRIEDDIQVTTRGGLNLTSIFPKEFSRIILS